MTTTPSAGAVRAAEKIWETPLTGTPTTGIPIIATIIDKETGLTDLVEALSKCCDELVKLTADLDPAKFHTTQIVYELAQAALAKHQGK